MLGDVYMEKEKKPVADGVCSLMEGGKWTEDNPLKGMVKVEKPE